MLFVKRNAFPSVVEPNRKKKWLDINTEKSHSHKHPPIPSTKYLHRITTEINDVACEDFAIK